MLGHGVRRLATLAPVRLSRVIALTFTVPLPIVVSIWGVAWIDYDRLGGTTLRTSLIVVIESIHLRLLIREYLVVPVLLLLLTHTAVVSGILHIEVAVAVGILCLARFRYVICHAGA